MRKLGAYKNFITKATAFSSKWLVGELLKKKKKKQL